MKRRMSSFWSVRWADKVKPLLPLAAGVLLTGLALAAAGRRISAVENDIRRQANPVEVIVASVAIPAGEEFSERNLAKKSVPSSGTGQRNVPAAEFELLLGGRAKIAIEEGEPILWSDVEEPFETESFSRRVLSGRRALTVGVDPTSSFAGLLHPGDRVDLLAEPSGSGATEWVHDISVIAVDRHQDRLARPNENPDAGTVTLMVTPREGARIARAAGNGKLHWFLRNPDDNTSVAIGASKKFNTAPQVEIWKGGLRIPEALPGKEARG
ncbi:MAG: Flp pilus assembly protein CpaB [Deltaproteobacteria bacterium]|nr:MAG: Flp pilus assembly protein CpaB [Deltaproteobacteria bacterium]